MLRLLSALRSLAHPGRLAALALLAVTSLLPAQGPGPQPPALPPGSEALQPPAGHVVSFRAFALGAQVYRWNGTTGTWVFQGPVAVVFAANAPHGPVGVHFTGPTWVSNSGSRVVGGVLAASTVDPTAIPWLLLTAVSTQGPGVFAPTTYIQRVHTQGGRAPARVGLPDETIWVPYSAEYFFWRAR